MARKELPCDVLITGGGIAGVAAALAAGRQGADVILVERNGYLGGTASAAEVGTICGLYFRDATCQKPRLASGGFPGEFAAAVQSNSDTEPLRVQPGLWVLPCPGPVFAKTCDDLLNTVTSTTLILHSTVYSAEVESGRCKAVEMLAWNEPLIVRPQAVVDCTGEATTTLLAGGEIYEGLTDQAPALVFTIDKVKGPVDSTKVLALRKLLREAVSEGALPALCEHLALVPSNSASDRLKLKLNLLPAERPQSAWSQVTQWERESRQLVHRVHRFIATALPEFKDSRLGSLAPQLGVRSGRRIRGRATLLDSDVQNAVKRQDTVARGAWPMERWGNGLRPEMAFFSEGDYYDIPLGCLRVSNLENLWAAGRCFSSSASAMSSARVIGTAMATGWAAGTAAALQAQRREPEDCIPILASQMNQ